MGGIITAIVGGIGGFFKGGLLGMVGGLIQKYLNHKTGLKEKDKEVELARLSVELAKATGSANALVETIKANAMAMAASYEHDTKTLNIGQGIQAFFEGENKKRSFWGYFLFIIAFGLDFIRGSLRPAMCYIYTGFSALIVWYAHTHGLISQVVIERCAEYTIIAWVEFSGMIVGWYFANRNDGKVQRK